MSDKMPRDPRKQAWLLWRARLEGEDPLDVVRRWRAAGSLKDFRAYSDQGVFVQLAAHLMGDPETFCFNGGSGNWPWVAAAAKDDLAWAESAAAVDLERGIGRIELGSPSYPERLLAQGYLLALGRHTNRIPVVENDTKNLRELVRRQWLLHAMSMVPGAATKVTVYGHDGVEVFEGKEAPAHWYSGWTCTLPMTRVNAASMRDSLLGYFVTKAMGAPCTYKRKPDPSPESPFWPLYALQKMGPLTFGGRPGVDHTFTDQHLAGLRSCFRFSLYRTDAGTACWIGWRGEEGVEAGPTTFKSTALFNRMDRDGHQQIALPQRWGAKTSDKGRGYLNDGVKVQAHGATVGYSLDLPPGKPTLWLEIGPDGARRVA